MAERLPISLGDNTPADDSAAANSYDLVMDEQRERWRTATWRAKPEDFAISRDELTADTPAPAQLDPDRLSLDIGRDLVDDSLSLRSLQALDYSASYRPRGRLDERISEPYSNPRKYEILAGVTQAPPEDISFLSDPERRRARMGERTGKLRRSSQRLDTSIDERRRQLVRMLPDDSPETEEIITESKKRRARVDREKGRKREKKELRRRFSSEVTYDEYLENYYAEHTERLEALPKQAGMAKSSQQLPQFASETRHWSRIRSANPSWSEVMRHTEVIVPEDDMTEPPEDARARYVSDDAFDPASRYRPMDGVSPRDAMESEYRSGQLGDEVVRLSGVDPNRARELMSKKYRGRWLPPEFFYDDALVTEYYNLSGRGTIDGEDFITWAQRQRAQIEDRHRAEEFAAQEAARQEQERMRRMRSAAPGRRHSPYAPPQVRRARADEREMYERAREQGYERAREYLEAERAEQERVRAEEKRRAEQAKREKKEKQRRAEEKRRAEYDEYVRQTKKAQEQYHRQAEKARREYEKQAAAATPKGGYSGMYPDLFESYGKYDPYNKFSDGADHAAGAAVRKPPQQS